MERCEHSVAYLRVREPVSPPPSNTSPAAASADPATAEPRADLLSHSSHKEKKNNYPQGCDVCLCEDAIAALSIVSAVLNRTIVRVQSRTSKLAVVRRRYARDNGTAYCEREPRDGAFWLGRRARSGESAAPRSPLRSKTFSTHLFHNTTGTRENFHISTSGIKNTQSIVSTNTQKCTLKTCCAIKKIIFLTDSFYY